MNKFNDFSNISTKGNIIDINFLPDEEFFKDKAYSILANNDDELKPFSIINIKNIENKKNFELLVSHLINHDSRIREAVSFALTNISDRSFLKFFDKSTMKIIVQALLDINPNVVRNIIEFIKMSEELKKALFPLIIEKIEEVLFELSKYEDIRFKDNKEKSNKNHAKNKYTFNLYWLLETLSNFELKNEPKIENILTKTSRFTDYTIREKTALILSKMETPYTELLRKLKNDVNLYVKNQLL